MPIELGGEIFFTQRELADLGVRLFFKTARLGTENYVPLQDLSAKDRRRLDGAGAEHYMTVEEAREIVDMTTAEFEAFLQGDDLLPRLSPAIHRNRWYVSSEALKGLDPRFDRENFLTFDEALDRLDTMPEVLEEHLRPTDKWPEKIKGVTYLSRSRVEALAKRPPFDRERFISIYEASVELRVKTGELRKRVKKGRVPAKKVGSEWFITRETLERLRQEDAH